MLFSLFLLVVALQAAPTPPVAAPPPPPFDCSAPEYRQFDFWIGEWDVVPNPATRPASAPPPQPGRQPARNVVTRIQGGCVVLESWEDGAGGTGQSFNIFDRSKQRWHPWSPNYDLIYTRRAKTK